MTCKKIKSPAVTDAVLKTVDDPVRPSMPREHPVAELVVGLPKSEPDITTAAVNPPVAFVFTSKFVSVALYGILYKAFVFVPVAMDEDASIVNVATSVLRR